MPKTTKPPAYRLYKRTGQAVVTLGGRDYYLGPHGTKTSRGAYDRLVGECLTNGRTLSTEGESPITVTELVAGYWRFAKGYYRQNGKPTPELGRVKTVIRALKRLYGRTTVTEFGPLRLKALRQEFVSTGICRRHANQQIGCVKRLFKWSVENELVPPSVFHGLQAVPGLKRGRTAARETPSVTPVPEEHVTAVLLHVPRPVAAMIRFQVLTGMRCGEVRIIRGCDLNTTGRVWTYAPAQHKNTHRGIARTVYLGPRAQEVVRPFLRADTTEYLFSPLEAREERYTTLRRHRKSKVPPSQRNRRKVHPKRLPGACYSREGYRLAVVRGCKEASVDTWTPARLRHNAATRFRKEYGLEAAQLVLGHAKADVTQIYAERDEERAMSVVAKIG